MQQMRIEKKLIIQLKFKRLKISMRSLNINQMQSNIYKILRL